jgi:hypothetical protein
MDSKDKGLSTRGGAADGFAAARLLARKATNDTFPNL